MILTQKSISKQGTAAYFTGAAAVLRFPLNAFPGKTAPATIEIPDGIFAPTKVKMTAEERKALRATMPKKTLAEKAAAAQARYEKLAAKLAAEGATL